MHTHDHAHDHAGDETSLRPKAARLDSRPPAELLQAAASGRSDVLDGAAILGLQRAVGNSGVGALLEEDRSPVHDVVNSGGGSPLAPDKYDPSSSEGKTMLAHELTHVVQQRSGPVDGTSAAGGIKVSDPSDRFEREASANADRVMSADVTASPAAGTPSATAAVQRDEAPEEEEETAQGSFVQREEAPEEEEEMAE